MWMDAYKARINAEGENVQENLLAANKRTTEKYIMNSPNLKYATVGDEANPRPCIVSDIRTYEERRFLFLPDVDFNLGTYLSYQDKTYLIINKNFDDLHPHHIGEFCNADFPVSTKTERIMIGRDHLNKPIYEDRITSITKPCVMSGKIYSQANNSPMPLQDGIQTVKIPYSSNPDHMPKINQKVVIKGDTYKVTVISKEYVVSNIGYAEVQIEREPDNG